MKRSAGRERMRWACSARVSVCARQLLLHALIHAGCGGCVAAGRREPGQLAGIVHGARGVRLPQLARIVPELLGQAAPPANLDQIAGLPDGTGAPRDATRHEAGVTAMFARQQRYDAGLGASVAATP